MFLKHTCLNSYFYIVYECIPCLLDIIAPEGFAAPVVQNTSFGIAEIKWERPTNPNGIITVYLIERALMSDDNNVTWINIATINVNESTSLVYIDTTAEPFTMYIYRIIAENGGGNTSSSYTSFLTPEAGKLHYKTLIEIILNFLNIAPENFTQPRIMTINETSLLISWEEPLIPNGIIRSYTITRGMINDAPIGVATVNSAVFNYTDQGLEPFTSYNYTIIAATAGGSTETDSSVGVTAQALASGLSAPLTMSINSTTFFVSWSPPSELNGILLSYSLYRISDTQNATLVY